MLALRIILQTHGQFLGKGLLSWILSSEHIGNLEGAKYLSRIWIFWKEKQN